MGTIREFGPSETEAAIAFLGEMEPEFDRFYIEERDGVGEWRLTFGADTAHVRQRLSRVRDGKPFRIRAVF